MNDNLNFLFRSILHYADPVICPNCKGRKSTLIDRKYLVARLFECNNCSLYFRHPPDSVQFNEEFYQESYDMPDKVTTDLPDEATLKSLIDDEFKLAGKNADKYITLFNAIIPDYKSKRLIDFGASWGYISYQFIKAGIVTESYEISKSRAKFGKNLGVEIKTNTEDLTLDNDVFFSSHVIEHVPDISEMIRVAKSKLSQEGYFIAICPNGDPEFRKKEAHRFHKGWGKFHPNYLNSDFYKKTFCENPYYIGTDPFNLTGIRKWHGQGQCIDENLSGHELLVIARVNMKN